MSKATQVWSCGGGVQSAAVAALIKRGRLPAPDVALIVDTNHEKSTTWEYLDAVLRPQLADICEVVRVDSSEYRTVGLFSRNEGSVLLPMFTILSGGKGKLPAFCSAEWKRDVAMRYMRRTLGIERAVNWLGISRDEMRRVRAPRAQWLQHRYPLIFDVPMRRQECIDLVAEMGWPEAPRTSCYFCPNMQDAEWREMKENSPEDFAHAVEVERQIRERDPHAYLHESCIPLDQVDFTKYQSSFQDSSCAGGACWV